MGLLGKTLCRRSNAHLQQALHVLEVLFHSIKAFIAEVAFYMYQRQLCLLTCMMSRSYALTISDKDSIYLNIPRVKLMY